LLIEAFLEEEKETQSVPLSTFTTISLIWKEDRVIALTVWIPASAFICPTCQVEHATPSLYRRSAVFGTRTFAVCHGYQVQF
jgi:hypothetical protein